MKSSITVTLDTNVLTAFRRKASEERRSVSQQLSLLVEKELGLQPPVKNSKPSSRRPGAIRS